MPRIFDTMETGLLPPLRQADLLYEFLTNGDKSNAKACEFVPHFSATKSGSTKDTFPELLAQVFHLSPRRPTDAKNKVQLADAKLFHSWIDKYFAEFVSQLPADLQPHWNAARSVPPPQGASFTITVGPTGTMGPHAKTIVVNSGSPSSSANPILDPGEEVIGMTDETSEGRKASGVGDLVNTGAEIAGGAIGGALGFFAAGPAGAAAFGAGGAAIGLALKRIGEEASKRLLGPREQVRVGGVLALTAAEVRERLKAGQKIRDDDFFEKKAGGRSDAEEVAESVLLRSQREAEERKLPYMAHLLSSIAFDKSISAQLAHQLTKTAEALTYRQLCLLKIAVFRQEIGLRAENYRNAGAFQKELYQVLYECLDLYTRALVNFGGEVAFGPTDVQPGSMTVQGLGADLYNLMSLHAIPNSDLAPIAAQLK